MISLYKRRRCFLCASLFACAMLQADPPARVVLISVDGLRADAVTAELMPFVHGLLEKGTYTLEAQSLPPTYTVPNHVSILTGLTPATHGILELVDTTGIIVDGTIAELAHLAGKTSAIYVSKKKLQCLNKPGTNDRYVMTDTGYCDEVVKALLEDLAAPETTWALSFIHLQDLDTVGHASGWMSDPCRSQVTKIDGYVRQIFSTVDAAGLTASTALLVVSDHGGLGTSHADETRPEVRNVPWVAVGPGIPGNVQIRRAMGVHDTAPTVLRLLGLEIPASMEGRAVGEVFGEVPVIFRRGDVDSSGSLNLTDGVVILSHLFLGGEASCLIAADTDDDAVILLTDAVYLLNHLFLGGPPPAPPFPHCGPGLAPSPDLTCLGGCS